MTLAIRSTWERFAHGSDVGIRGIGPSKDVAFEQIGMALTSVISDPEYVVGMAIMGSCN